MMRNCSHLFCTGTSFVESVCQPFRCKSLGKLESNDPLSHAKNLRIVADLVNLKIKVDVVDLLPSYGLFHAVAVMSCHSTNAYNEESQSSATLFSEY